MNPYLLGVAELGVLLVRLDHLLHRGMLLLLLGQVALCHLDTMRKLRITLDIEYCD